MLGVTDWQTAGRGRTRHVLGAVSAEEIARRATHQKFEQFHVFWARVSRSSADLRPGGLSSFGFSGETFSQCWYSQVSASCASPSHLIGLAELSGRCTVTILINVQTERSSSAAPQPVSMASSHARGALKWPHERCTDHRSSAQSQMPGWESVQFGQPPGRSVPSLPALLELRMRRGRLSLFFGLLILSGSEQFSYMIWHVLRDLVYLQSLVRSFNRTS